MISSNLKYSPQFLLSLLVLFLAHPSWALAQPCPSEIGHWHPMRVQPPCWSQALCSARTRLPRTLRGITLSRFPMLWHLFPWYFSTYFTDTMLSVTTLTGVWEPWLEPSKNQLSHVFGFLWSHCCSHHLSTTPQPLKSSICTCFQGLWASSAHHHLQNPWNQVFVLDSSQL